MSRRASGPASPPSEALSSSRRTDRDDLKAQYERLRLLYQVSNVIHASVDAEGALKSILAETVRLTRATSGSIALVNPTTNFLEIQASHGLPPQARQLQLRVGEGITGWVARTGQPARVGDVTADPRYIPVRPNVRSELAVPMDVGDEVRGVLNVDADRVEAFSAEDQGLLEELAVQAAKVIHRTWLYEQLRLKARLFESLFHVGQTINSAPSLDDALTVITREACQLTQTHLCALLLLDETGEWLDLKACHGAGEAYRGKPRLNVADSLLGSVVRRRRSIQVQNVQTSSRYQHLEIARQEGLVALLSVPLTYGGNAIGTLSVYTSQPHVFSNEEIRILSALADLSAIAIEKARLHERLVDIEEHMRQNEKLSALGLLAAEVAHEIRNPLTVMKMLYHSLDLRFSPEDPRSRDAELMSQKIDHLNHIVEHILDFARNAEPRFAPVQVNRLLDELLLLVRHKLRQQNITLERRLDRDLPEICADAVQLEQAFLNLVLNAVEAMPQGGLLMITSRTIRMRRENNRPTHLAVTFSDTGHGMTEEQQQRVFTSLLSTTKARGTGLGLALVGKVVEAHKGRIRVKSAPGGGSRFVIMLPVETLPQGESQANH